MSVENGTKRHLVIAGAYDGPAFFFDGQAPILSRDCRRKTTTAKIDGNEVRVRIEAADGYDKDDRPLWLVTIL